MRDRSIEISAPDALLLRGLLRAHAAGGHDQEHVAELRSELERAQVLEPDEISPKVVTMHRTVQVLDLVSGERQRLVLVSPSQADVRALRISVLAPLGTALLGYREGDDVEWPMPGGVRRLRIERVLHQARTH